MKRFLLASVFVALAACSPPAPQQKAEAAPEAAALTAARPTPVKVDAPAGVYVTDKAHSTLIFQINHMGYSNFTARFTKFDVKLNLDPTKPEAATVEATIDPKSIAADNAPDGFMAQLYGPDWLDAKQYPAITFKSTQVKMTGADTADVTGDFTLHGVTKPIVLKAKFNGGYPGMVYDPNARIGFSVHGAIKRSEFGMAAFILQPGSNMGVSDDIAIAIETEMTGPAWKDPAKN
jgi:polyisoprenoid-binding protein YceI